MFKIAYYLRKALLPRTLDKYQALLVPNGKLDRKGIINEMMEIGSGVSIADAEAVMNLYDQVRLKAASRGIVWDDGLVSMRFSVGGLFDGPGDHYQDGRNELRVHFSASRRLHKALKSLRMEKVEVPAKLPELYNVLPSGQALAGGELAKLEGTNLEFDQEDSSQGLSLLSAAGEHTPITRYSDPEPKTVRFLLPQSLGAGDYTLQFHGLHGSAEIALTLV